MQTKKGKLTIIFGGQFGSEGKGRIAAHIAKKSLPGVAVRVGGPNAGHTFYMDNKEGNQVKVVVQTIPVAAMMGSMGYIGPAGMIIPELLIEELKAGFENLGKPVNLAIHTNAAVIRPEHQGMESGLATSIGSTREGVGACTAGKVMRDPKIVVGYDENKAELLDAFTDHTTGRCFPWSRGVSFVSFDVPNLALLGGDDVMLEGTQGFGLSLHTGGFYPFCTSRECTPQALLAETGTGPHNAQDVESIMVIRTYPIRVGGNSGPLANEITWDDLRDRTNGYVTTPERTTVTKKIRRIAEIDRDLLRRAVMQCGPTALAVNFLDYLFPELANVNSVSLFPQSALDYLQDLSNTLGVPVKYVSWGPMAD